MPRKSKRTGEVDQLTLKYVDLDTVIQWDRNTKKHDINGIISSLVKHGFKDPVKYEPALNKGAGGIVEGNGRIESLRVMRNQNKEKPPRGIVIQDGKWLVPVLFGVDSKSQSAAESYGMDHNNLTLGGSDISFEGMMSMWGEGTADMMKGLQADGEMPITITAAGLDSLLESDKEKLSERDEVIRPKTMLRILISLPAATVIDAQKHIEAIKNIPGAEVDYGGN